MEKNLEIKKLADIAVWADNLITAAGFDVEKYKNDAASAYCHVKAYELWKIKTVVLDSMERHTVYTNALNKDIADKAAKIELLEKEIEGRKEGYVALKTQMDNLKKELEETYRTKEADLKNHNKRDMTLVDELAKKNDEIKELKEEVEYYKNQERIRTDQLRATERKVDELWGLVNELKKDKKEGDDYVKSGFKLYVKNALIEAKGNKNEANEVITDAVKFCFNEWDKTQKENEKTIKKAIKEVMSKKFGYTWETVVRLRSEVDKKRIVDISEGAERILGVSRELFDDAVKALVNDGYQEIIGRIPQATNSYVCMEMHVLASPDVKTKDTANPENIKSLDSGIPCGEDSIE